MATKTEQTVKGSKKFQSDVEISNGILLKNFTLTSQRTSFEKLEIKQYQEISENFT